MNEMTTQDASGGRGFALSDLTLPIATFVVGVLVGVPVAHYVIPPPTEYRLIPLDCTEATCCSMISRTNPIAACTVLEGVDGPVDDIEFSEACSVIENDLALYNKDNAVDCECSGDATETDTCAAICERLRDARCKLVTTPELMTDETKQLLVDPVSGALRRLGGTTSDD